MPSIRRVVIAVVALPFVLASTGCVDRTAVVPVAAWTLTEELRVGSMEEGPASFGRIKSIEADGQGRVWVLDLDASEIRVFDPSGAHLQTVGRKGKGPGEFTSPEGIAFGPDGRLWVRDASGSRFQIFNAEGTFEQSWTVTFCSRYGPWTPQMQAERILDIDCVVSEGRSVGRSVLAYHTDMAAVDTLGPIPECGTKELKDGATFIKQIQGGFTVQSVPWAPQPLYALGAAGELWCVPNSARAEVLRLVPGAVDTVRVAITTPDVLVTAAERDSAIAEFERNGPTGHDYGRIPGMKPKIERLTVDDRGRLWVQLLGQDGGIEFAVVSPEGTLVASARLGAVRTADHLPFIVRGNTIHMVTFDHEDVPYVTRFAISASP